MHVTFVNDAKVAADAKMGVDDFAQLADALVDAVPAQSSKSESLICVRSVLEHQDIAKFLTRVAGADVFSADCADHFSSSANDLRLLRSYKLLKYCYNLPVGQLFTIFASIVTHFRANDSSPVTELSNAVLNDSTLASKFLKHLVIAKDSPISLRSLYEATSIKLLDADPHAIYPTSIYRQCFGHITSSDDSCVIEGVMGTSITTTIEIVRDVLSPECHQLRDVYKPLGRCVAVVDERLDGLYGDAMVRYFAAHNIKFEKLVYRCMEVDKDISTVERILVDLKAARVSRNEPVLVVGGGVMADVGGFACALYHRNTPYVMLCTSIVSGIDAGPSPRTCCDGLGYKNVFGAYHPPVLTLTDRQFFKTLKPGWIRHGIAEIIKMAVTKDATLFDDLEAMGNRLVETKFGVENCERGSEIDMYSERIIAKAMQGYVQSEYGNLWETHQARPHAYGHTWSPGFELQAGLLHGHAVAIGMGFGAYLSFLEGWITEAEFHRILRVMSAVGLSLRHDILENSDSLWSSQVKMTEKRGGNLCAPVPRGSIGKCGYINDVSRERLEQTLADYQDIVRQYPREGLGIEPHCADVGLEDPSTVKQHADHAVAKGSLSHENDCGKPKANGNACTHVANGNEHAVANGDGRVANGNGHTLANGHGFVANGNGHTPANGNGSAANGNGHTPVNGASNIEKYNEWIASAQAARNSDRTSSVIGTEILTQVAKDTANPPQFPHATLFHDEAEEYAAAMTTLSSDDFAMIAEETKKANLFAPCMVGKIEGQFLKMMAQIKGAKRVLDIGTFTGYSALAFAQGVGAGGEVVSLEADAPTAAVARKCFAEAGAAGTRVTLVECDARVEVERMASRGEKFDIVFLDADKVNYRHYYEAGLKMLTPGGLLLADNALCSLVYAEDDPVRQSLHEFAQYVRADSRVEQCMLTVREGILMVSKV